MIETEPLTLCPACTGTGAALLRDSIDYVCGLPGRWIFYECCQCHSLWPNPRPVESALASLYPPNYGFTRNVEASIFPSGIAGSAKLAVLARHFGYDSLEQRADRQIGVWLGRSLGIFLRGKAGHAVRYLRQRPEGRLLDVGCGNGAFLQWMSQLGWQVEGIEVDPAAAQYAIDRGLTVRIGNVEDVDLPLSHFDAITLTHVTEHFFNPAKIFAILSRSLKPDGVLVSTSPNPAGIVRRLFRNKWYGLDPPRHLFLPTTAGYRRLLEPLGFEVKTWTSMRLFHWYFKESLSIAMKQKVGGLHDSALLKCATAALSTLFLGVPGAGEEVVCYARNR